MSRWGLIPPEFSYKGEPFQMSAVNKWLWECLTDMLKEYPTPDVLIINGDTRDGPQWRNRGEEVNSTSVDFQNHAAYRVMERIARHVPIVYAVEGTKYHETEGESLYHALGAHVWPDGAHYGQVLDLRIAGHVLNVAHHPEGSPMLYKGTSMDRTALWATIAAAEGSVPNADVIIRSHWHWSGCFQARKTVIQTAGWQMSTPHMVTKAYFRYQPMIGFVDLLLEKDEDPIVCRRNYPLPPKEVVDGDTLLSRRAQAHR